MAPRLWTQTYETKGFAKGGETIVRNNHGFAQCFQQAQTNK